MTIQTDTIAAIACGTALWEVSGKRIERPSLAVMLAIAGRESNWDPNAQQAGGTIGAPGVGIGAWQITPGDRADFDLTNNATVAWGLMQRDPSSPFEPWNLTPDGFGLIYPVATLPDGQEVATVLPTPYQYLVGGLAAGLTFPYGHAL